MTAPAATHAPGRGRLARAFPFLVGLLLVPVGGWAVGQPVPGMPAAGVPPVPGQPAAGGPPRPMSQLLIDEAVNRGVSYLRKTQNQTGTWGKGTDVGPGGGWVVGYTALAGIALIEGGVSKDDPGLKKAAAVIRRGWTKLDDTYEVALAILFLDRMGDKNDRGAIQSLAVRLIAGQTGTGGWAYKVPAPSAPETAQVLAALKKFAPIPPAPSLSLRERPSALGLCIKASELPPPVKEAPKAGGGEPPDPEKAKAAALAALPPGVRRLPVFRDMDSLLLADPADKGSEPVNGTTDNSNTHFATVALWTARRHDVPTERSFALLTRRFRTSQASGGGWDYRYVKGGGGEVPAMTCIALLGVAIGHALALDKEAGNRPEADPLVLKAFGMLAKGVGAPTGRADNRPTVKEVGGLYYLWALERIAVLYDVSKLDKKDWYQWGAEILVCHQSPDGSWAEGGFPGQDQILNTALAIMFLKRANLTQDLSKRLIIDTRSLTASVGGAPTPPPPPAPEPPPAPKVEPPPAPKVETPAPKPAAVPVATPTVTATASAPAPAESSNMLLWIILAVVVVVTLAGGLFWVMRSKKAAAEEAARAKRKRGKRRPADEDEEDEDDEEEDEDDEEDDEEEEERPRKKKAPARAEAETTKRVKKK